MKVCVHGDTLFAWVASAKLAEMGNHVLLRTHHLQNSYEPSREPGLLGLIDTQQATKRLMVNLLSEAIPKGLHMHLIALDASMPDIEQIVTQVLTVNQHEIQPTIFVVLTTLPVGSLAALQQHAHTILQQQHSQHGAFITGMPFFGREGSALTDFSQPSLLLVSGEKDSLAVNIVLELMRPFARQATKVMVVPHTTAELIKLGINAMLATRISFINEMAALAEKLHVDIALVRDGLAADPRIGGAYLKAGCGFGGPSFSDELLSYAKTMQEELDTTGLLSAVLAINESQREILFRKIWRFFRGQLQGVKMAIWGASFKSGTASLENSVIHPLLQALWAQNCQTVVYDPMAGQALQQMYSEQRLLTVVLDDGMSAITEADGLVLVTAWDEFSSPDFERMKQQMRQAVIFDGRNIYDPEYMQEQGFRYFAIGRGEAI